MQKLPIHLLNAFVQFSAAKNITEASIKLGITQPALSKQLKQLEEILPSPIFTTSGRKKVLTPFGRDLYSRLNERIGNIQAVASEVWSLHESKHLAKIKIAARRGVLDRISGKLKFEGAVFFEEQSNDEVISSLLSLKTQIGVVHNAPNTLELISKPLFKEEFHLAIPKNLLSKAPEFGDKVFLLLKELPCLGYRPDDEIIKTVCGYSLEEMRQLKVVRSTENYKSLAEMVDSKLGWAILPTYIEISQNKNWILKIPHKAFPAKQFYVVYRAEFAKVHWFKELIQEVRLCF